MDPSTVIDVYGLIGTPALWKEHAALVWRVGPCYLFEEALSSEAVALIYTQGTSYMGNFLALRNTGKLQVLWQQFPSMFKTCSLFIVKEYLRLGNSLNGIVFFS